VHLHVGELEIESVMANSGLSKKQTQEVVSELEQICYNGKFAEIKDAAPCCYRTSRV